MPRHLIVLAGEGLEQRRVRLAVEPRADLLQRDLTVVEREGVDEVEDPRIGDRAQLGRRIAAAEGAEGARPFPGQPLADAERADEHAGERAGEADEIDVGRDGVPGRLDHHLLDDVGRAGQLGGQRVEAHRVLAQLLGVLEELEVRGDGLAEERREILHREGDQLARVVDLAPLAVPVVARHRTLEPEARPLGDVVAAGDPMGERGVASLQERHRLLDDERIALALVPHVLELAGEPTDVDGGEEALEPGAAVHPQHELEAEVDRVHAVPELAQPPGQARHRGVRRVEVRDRRNDEGDVQHDGQPFEWVMDSSESR